MLKKIFTYLVIALCISVGYQFLTGESIIDLPGKVVDFLYHPEKREKSANVYHDTKMVDEISRQTP